MGLWMVSLLVIDLLHASLDESVRVGFRKIVKLASIVRWDDWLAASVFPPAST